VACGATSVVDAGNGGMALMVVGVPQGLMAEKEGAKSFATCFERLALASETLLSDESVEISFSDRLPS
jgi:hypothetical protein